MYTIDHLIENRNKKNPESIAFYKHTSSGRMSLTAHAFCEEKRALAYALENLGLKRGDVVGILSSVRYEWELAEKAVLSIGCASFGIDVRHTIAEITQEITTGSIDLLFVENEILLKNVPEVFTGTIILIDEGAPERPTTQLSELIRLGDGKVPTQKATPDDFAIIISTSGTTGHPKLIRYRNRHIVAACLSIIEMLELQTEKTNKRTALCWLPLVYMTSKIMNLVDYVIDGEVHFLGNPREITNALQTTSPSHFVAVPIFYERLYKGLLDELAKLPFLKKFGVYTILFIRKHVHIDVGAPIMRMIRHKLFGKHLEYCVSGSAPLSTEIIHFFKLLDVDILEAYALSENAIPVAMNRPTHHKAGSVGRILNRNKVRFEQDGEILVIGEGIFEGYIGHESENKELFTNDGYLKTGDIGHLDADGFLYLTGRKKSLIKTANGYRISPIEVEATYEPILYIKQILVVGDRQKFLGALIVLDVPHIESFLEAQGMKKMSSRALTKDPQVITLITDELKKHDQTLAVYKRVACFALITEPFSVEKEELTPNFKMRRDIITKHYHSEIEAMFKNVDPA